MLIVQNTHKPAAIRHAIVDSLEEGVVEFRISSAYMTLGACKIFRECCMRYLTEAQFASMQKHIVTSLDFGLTDPDAIRFWKALPNSDVRIAGAEMLKNVGGGLSPSRAYHPKIYSFGFPENRSTILVGSANLTNRGLTINTETIWQQKEFPHAGVVTAWQDVIENTVIADDAIINAYAAAKVRIPRQPVDREIEPVPAKIFQEKERQGLPIFSLDVESKKLFPESFSEMWVQVEQLQGGSRNQLELPRGAHRFFGFQFNHYGVENVEHIGNPVLVSGRQRWSDRPLTWHGDNKMERINLPTLAQGGFDYANSAIIFRKVNPAGNIFEIYAAKWDADIARAWVNASSEASNLYRLGQRTSRLAGFIKI